MSETERISQLEQGVNAIQQQLAVLSQAILASQNPAPTPPPAPEPTPIPETFPESGTIIRDGETVSSKGGMPSDRSGIVKLSEIDPVHDHYSKKRYSNNPTKGGVFKGNLDPTLYQDPPKSVAEMPEADHPTSFSNEEVPPESVVDDVNQAVSGITPEIKRFLDLVLGKTSASTKAEYSSELSECLKSLGVTSEISVDTVGAALTSIIEGLKEEYLRDLVVKSAPEFLEYVSEIQGDLLAKDYIAESLKTFMQNTSKEDLEVIRKGIGVSVSGEQAPYVLTDAALLGLKSHTGDVFIVSPKTDASVSDEGYISSSLLKGDMILLSHSDIKLSARFIGTEHDDHGNIIHKFSEAQEDSDESALPPGLSYLS